MRLAIYTDYIYQQHDGEVFGERAFTLFLAELAEHVDEAIVVGRLDPAGEASRYPIGERVHFSPLPYYSRLDRIGPVLRTLGEAARRFWRTLDRVDCVWVLGPNPFAIVFACMALARRKRVVLGVRSEMVPYVRSRHPDRRGLQYAALGLDAGFKLLSRWCPVIAVGPVIGAQYSGSRAVLEILVSLVDRRDIAAATEPRSLDEQSELTILSVGRLESEKNPLLLADCLSALHRDDPRWRLVVCGEGPMEADLRRRLESLGVADAAEFRGYVPLDGGLRELYAESDFLLHASWTEGFPQVLLEAFAAGLPVVATDVGGIRTAAGGAVRLITAGDSEAAVEALRDLAADPRETEGLAHRGRAFALDHTTEVEVGRVAAFIGAV